MCPSALRCPAWSEPCRHSTYRQWYVTVSQLRGKLRELRFYLGARGDAVRICYYIASQRRIILLTVFTKQRRRERAEIDRAERAMKRCIEDGHTAEEEIDV
jgi:hypothetical protein